MDNYNLTDEEFGRIHLGVLRHGHDWEAIWKDPDVSLSRLNASELSMMYWVVENRMSKDAKEAVAASSSAFAHLVRAPEDPILGVTVAYAKDPSPIKLNLGADDYQTEDGKPLDLDVVRRVERQLLNDVPHNKQYIPMVGLADFNQLTAKLIFGADSPAIQENRVTTVQGLSGSGTLRVGGEFLAAHFYCSTLSKQQKAIYLPEPAWDNHSKVFNSAGLTVNTYRYYNPVSRLIDFSGLASDLGSAPSGSVVLLHACGNNPTGVDPTLEEWEQIRKLIRSKSLLPFFYSAYQGFASGSLNADAQPVRSFVSDGGELLVAHSYATNMGLYGERVGALSIVSKSADVASRVESLLKLVIRPMYLSPPIHGASIVAAILKDRDLCNEWTTELKAMADRIINMRQLLFNALQNNETPGDWSHIIRQIGMFTFTGLSSEQVSLMAEEHHIYMTSDGRINMSCLSSETVPHMAEAIHAVTVAYNNHPGPIMLNLDADAYRNEEGKPLVLDVVRRVESQILNDVSRNKQYIPILGLADFNLLTAKLIFGADSPAIQENRVTIVQGLSGTGALRVGGEFLAAHYFGPMLFKQTKYIYLPRPIWGNHPHVFNLAGLTVLNYRYYDPGTQGLDFQGLIADLGSARSGSVVLLHACGHNPTGVDPTLEEWEQIRILIRSKSLLPFFYSAYQGFAGGSLDADAQPVRLFVSDGGELLVAHSYATNMGLYGERVGALSIVSKSADVASRVESLLKLVIRPMYLSPPIHGASIVAAILKDRDLYSDWTIELQAMADRIINMRQLLFDALHARGTPGDWSHLIRQIGMFSLTGLNPEQVSIMAEEYHISMTSDGRINISGLNSETVPRLADAIHAVVTQAA